MRDACSVAQWNRRYLPPAVSAGIELINYQRFAKSTLGVESVEAAGWIKYKQSGCEPEEWTMCEWHS